jgi:hypothetical protein
MADNIVISAVAKVIDQASAPLKAIQGVIAGVADTAAKTGGAIADVGAGISKAVGGMTGRLGTAASKVGGFVRSMAGIFGPISGLMGLGGIAGLTSTIGDFISKTKELSKSAQTLGVTTDALQTMYEVFGGSAERGTQAMEQLQKTLVNVSKGGKEIQPTIALLRKMGVTMDEIKKGNLEAVLPKIMESFSKNTDPIVRGRMAVTLFGKSWQDFLPYLVKGKEGYAAAAEAARKYLITQEGIAAGKEAGAALVDLSNAVDGVRNSIAQAILPAFTPMVKIITEWVDANRELLKQTALPIFIGSIASAVIGLGIAVAAALGFWTLLAGAIVAAGVAIYQNWDAIIKWIDQEVPGLTSTIAKAGADIWAFVQKSASDIAKGFETGGLAGGVTAYVTAFKAAWVGVGQWFADLFTNVDWNAVGSGAATMLWGAFVAVIQAQAALGQFIIDQFNAALDFIKTADWASIGRQAGQLLGQMIMMELRAVVAINEWGVELGAKLINAIATADWGKITTSILRFFLDLQTTFLKMGWDLINGLISGMIDAIPGLRKVTDQISSMFDGAIGWIKGAAGSVANVARDVATAAGESLARGSGQGGLLAQPGVAGTQRSEVTTNINVNAPPGSSVTTSQSKTGAPVDGGVNVGASTMATGTP